VIKCGQGVLLTTHPIYCCGRGRVELYLNLPSGPHGACGKITLLFTLHCSCLLPGCFIFSLIFLKLCLSGSCLNIQWPGVFWVSVFSPLIDSYTLLDVL